MNAAHGSRPPKHPARSDGRERSPLAAVVIGAVVLFVASAWLVGHGSARPPTHAPPLPRDATTAAAAASAELPTLARPSAETAPPLAREAASTPRGAGEQAAFVRKDPVPRGAEPGSYARAAAREPDASAAFAQSVRSTATPSRSRNSEYSSDNE